MATVNMNCVEFYDPNSKPALKASQAQLTKSVLNKHRLPLQPSRSPSAMSAGDVQDSDSLDDSLPSLEELLRPPQNRDIPQVPQNHMNVHISKRQLIDESRLLTDPITLNSVYVPGNTQREPLIIEDDSDGESDDEAEAGAALSDLHASIEDQDASECGLASQDTASTSSSLFGPSTPQDSEYPNTDCFSKDGQQRPSFAELDSAFHVQVRRPSPNCFELAETRRQDEIHQESVVDEMRPTCYNPLRERAGGSCDGGSVCNIEDELRHTTEEAEGSLVSSATHSRCNQMNQESQNNTAIQGSSSEERMWEKTVEQQQCQQKEQEDEDDIEATSSENKGLSNYCQQTNESLQQQRVEDETIVAAPISQNRQLSVKQYDEDNEGNKDDEDEDVRPPRRRKRRRIESDAIETVTCKKVHTRSSTIAQAQTCTTRSSTISQSSPADAESILGADYQEYPLQGFLKCVRIGRETTYNLEFSLLDLPDSFKPSFDLQISNSRSSEERVGESAHPQLCASHAKRSRPAPLKQRKRGHLQYTWQEDKKLLCLKAEGLPWKSIHLAFNRAFPERERSIGSLQVRYCNELKNRDTESDNI